MTASSVAQVYRLGGVERYAADERGVTFECGIAHLRVSVVATNIVRIRAGIGGVFAERRVWAVNRDDGDWEVVAFTTEETEDAISVKTGAVTVQIARSNANVTVLDKDGHVICEDGAGLHWQASGKLVCEKRMPDTEHYYGCGERTSLLDKRGRVYTNWTTDPFFLHGDHGPGTDEMYQANPFYLALRAGEGIGYGFFLTNTYRSRFDFEHTQRGVLSIETDGGEFDYYIINGPTPAQILEGYTAIVGRMPVPPLWALGYQQCRWSYMSADEVRRIAREFRSRNLPCEVIVLDIDYMRGFRVFTWNNQTFGDHEAMLKELSEQGFKLVTIIDPGVKVDLGSDYPVFDTAYANNAFIKDADGQPWRACVWPGDCGFPDFSRADVRAWWADLNSQWIAQGVAGIWNDMNEPAANDRPFGYPGGMPTDAPITAPQGDNGETTWAETHNLYGYLENMSTFAGLKKAQPDERPFILTRSGFAGIQKYAAVWTGDNTSYWEHLEMTLPQLANLGLSGVAFCGSDIGGFGGNASGELFARWMQLGTFYPFMRGHSSQGTQMHEPWIFGTEVEDICRRYLELRYRLLPYLYSLFENTANTGAPVWRPMFYHFPDDPATIALHDQVMIGDALLVAPIYCPNQVFRQVYLPAGVWYDYWTGERFDGPVHILAEAPLDTIPLYTRGGTVIPHGPKMQYTGEKPVDSIRYSINPDARGSAIGRMYEDDGHSMAYTRGESAITTVTCTRENGTLIIKAQREGTYTPTARTVRIRVYGTPASQAQVNGQDAPISQTDDGALMIEVGNDSGAWEVRIS